MYFQIYLNKTVPVLEKYCHKVVKVSYFLVLKNFKMFICNRNKNFRLTKKERGYNQIQINRTVIGRQDKNR